MSHEARSWAIACPISGPAKAVLMALSIRSDDEDKCWPSIDTIAFDAGISVRCAQENLRWLEGAGLLTTEGMGGRRLTRMYRLRVGGAPIPCEKRVRAVRKTVRVVQERVRDDAGIAPSRAPEPSREPIKEPSQNPQKQTALILPMVGGKAKGKPAPAASPPVEWPSWLPIEAWSGFVESRRKMRKPLTDRAIHLILDQLAKYRSQGIDIEAAINNSVVNGWPNIYSPKPDRPRFSAAEEARNSHFAPPAWHDEAPVIDGELARGYGG